jgi:hypothetical protein
MFAIGLGVRVSRGSLALANQNLRRLGVIP